MYIPRVSCMLQYGSSFLKGVAIAIASRAGGALADLDANEVREALELLLTELMALQKEKRLQSLMIKVLFMSWLLRKINERLDTAIWRLQRLMNEEENGVMERMRSVFPDDS